MSPLKFVEKLARGATSRNPEMGTLMIGDILTLLPGEVVSPSRGDCVGAQAFPTWDASCVLPRNEAIVVLDDRFSEFCLDVAMLMGLNVERIPAARHPSYRFRG